MGSSEASITWRIGDETMIREVQLRDNKLLLSQFFLQSLLPPFLKFLSLKAVIQVGQEHMEVETPSQWDVEGHEHFMLDSSLSTMYVMEHSSASLYISDSENTEDCSKNQRTVNDYFQGCSDGGLLNDVIDLEAPLKEIVKNSFVDLESSEEEKQKRLPKSTLKWILENPKGTRLQGMIQNSSTVKEVKELPRTYNGNITFELPPTYNDIKRMEGMEQKFDGHLWTRPHRSNMSLDCVVRLSYCLGSMECHRITCPYFLNNKKFNDSYFHGFLDKQVSKGLLCEDERNSITCHYCKKIVFCKEPCSCMVYYVFPVNSEMTRLMVHIGNHSHAIQIGTSRAAIERIKKLVSTVLQVDRNSGPRRVQMIVARQLLVDAILGNENSEMGETELSNILEEMIPLVQNQRFKTIVACEKRLQATVIGDGYDNILQLKKKCMFPFFHGSRFPGQGGPNDKCFIFKMSTKGPGSGVDLVNRMRRSKQGDLCAAWVHFDHTHRINGWATMSCSVYDPSLKGLMVIAICETKEEDTDSQILFWNCLNEVMQQQGYPPADFAGFMADEAGANWLAIRTVFNGGPDNVLSGRERSCLFHWEQSLQKHTKRLVRKEVLQLHIDMCEVWQKSPSVHLASKQAKKIREWWRDGHVAEENIKALERWFRWWEQRITHWGNLNPNTEIGPWERAQIPNTNLSESVHASWLAGEGGSKKICLYDACVTDVINAYIQCTKQHGYLTGRYIGTGPNMQTFLERVSSKKSPNPAVVARVVQGAVAGTPLYEEPVLYGDKETVQRKRARGTLENSSHRPGFVMESRQRKERGRPRKIAFDSQKISQSYLDEPVFDVNAESTDDDSGECIAKNAEVQMPSTNDFMVSPYEVDMSNCSWAIRRMPPQCVRKCFGVVQGKRCTTIMQSRSPGLVAPCFWGQRTYKGNTQHQWMWFCNHDVQHTKVVAKQVKEPPETPISWVIAKETRVTMDELASLVGAGFVFQSSYSSPQANNISGQNIEVGGSSKRSKKWRPGVSKEANKRLEAATKMQAQFIDENIVKCNRHVVFKILTTNYYEVHIKEEPMCTCPDFQRREIDKKSYLACKHMYFVYTCVLGLHRNQHMIIHQPTLGERDLSFILSQIRRLKPLNK